MWFQVEQVQVSRRSQRARLIHSKDERVITIEDTAELQKHQPHVVRLEKRPPNN